MQPLPGTDRSAGGSAEGWQDRDPSTPAERKQRIENAIAKANTVPLITILGKYGIQLDSSTIKIVCPFRHHANGNERTGSFRYYHEDNSFWCFGCKVGRKPSDFVAAYEEISRAKAAFKILRMFENETSEDWETVACNSQEKQELIVGFSNLVRGTILEIGDPSRLQEIEMITFAFDKIIEEHELDIEALKALVAKASDRLPKG